MDEKKVVKLEVSVDNKQRFEHNRMHIQVSPNIFIKVSVTCISKYKKSNKILETWHYTHDFNP